MGPVSVDARVLVRGAFFSGTRLVFGVGRRLASLADQRLRARLLLRGDKAGFRWDPRSFVRETRGFSRKGEFFCVGPS